MPLQLPPAVLAPMEGVSNYPARLWFWMTGTPAGAGTPFLRATYSFPHRELPMAFCPEILHPDLVLQPRYGLTLQIMAADAEHFIRAVRMVPSSSTLTELNAGCPSPTCTGRGAGSSLLRDTADFRAFVTDLAEACAPGQLAVKVRSGFETIEEFPRILGALQDLPLGRLTVHARTRRERYTGSARWDLIQAAAAVCTYPVFASGDVTSAVALTERIQLAPDIAGCMVGRGALRSPWIFRELRTGAPPLLTLELVLTAVQVLGHMIQIFADAPERLMAWDAGVLTRDPPGTDIRIWQQILHSLTELRTMGSRWPNPARLPCQGFSRETLGRLKLFWNYLRSSLPDGLFAGLPLRGRTIAELLHAVRALAQATGLDVEQEFRPVWRPELDRFYGGGGATDDAGSCSSAPRGVAQPQTGIL